MASERFALSVSQYTYILHILREELKKERHVSVWKSQLTDFLRRLVIEDKLEVNGDGTYSR